MILNLNKGGRMMKKISIVWGLAALLFAGCNKQAGEVTVPTRTIQVTATVEQPSPEGKATWVDGDGFNWDAASVESTEFGIGAIAAEGAAFNRSTAVEISDGSALVTVAVPENFTSAYLFYPWTGSYGHDANTVLAGAWYTISGNQTQSQAGTMDSAANKMALVSASAIEASATGYSAVMSCQSALVRFIVFSATATDETVHSVALSVNNASISGNFHILVENGSVRTETAAGSVEAKVTLSTPYSLSGITGRDLASGIYLGIIPATTSGYTYTVVTSKGTYTFESSAERTFAAGSITNVFLNLDKATTKPGDTPSGEDVLLFNYQSMGPFALPKDGSGLAYTGAISSLTLNGADILDAAKAHPDLWSLSVSDDWLIPEFENTSNFNIRVKAKKNPTASARSGKIYLVYDGTVSETYLTVSQDPGPSYDIVPVLTKVHEAAISKDGETVAQAATLSLTVNGSASTDVAADVAAYGVSLTCGAATATVVDAAGNVQIVFPANDVASEKTYTLKASFESESSSVTFTQEANPGGGDEPAGCPYSFTFEFCGVSTNPDGPSGFNPNFNDGVYFRLRNVRLAGGEADITPTAEQAEEMIAYAFSFEDPESDMPAGYDSYQFDPSAITATVFNLAGGMVEYHITTWATRGYKARIHCKDSDGTVKFTAYAFIPF